MNSPQSTQRVEKYIYKQTPQGKLAIHIHFPTGWKNSDRRPVIIFFSGGGPNSRRLKQFAFQADYLAGRGMVAARAEYRAKRRDGVTFDKRVEDARSAVRWMRKNSKRLGIDPNKLITSGGSGGGHLAACMMIAKSVEAEGDDLSISTIP
jgi:acetyl esterase